jgi:hypothetical protein
MRHFFRTHLEPDEVMAESDIFFPALVLTATSAGARERVFTGALGTLSMRVRPEGGHYTFVQIETDQIGESRLDRNVKAFFTRLHRLADPAYRLTAAY